MLFCSLVVTNKRVVATLILMWLLSAQASQAKNTWCKGQFVSIENCMGKSLIMKKMCN